MAYGKNKGRKDWCLRATPLAVGNITPAKRARLFELRTRVLTLMREMAQAGFIPEPLDIDLSDELDARLLAVQTSCEDLNSVWREQARMRVKPALEETVKRYFKRLAGSLRFVDQRIADPGESSRRYYHIPESVQDFITASEIADLKALAGSGRGVDAFRQWRSRQHPFTPNQSAVLADIHERALRKHTIPDFGARDDFTLRLHIDPRMLPKWQSHEAQALRDGVGMLLADDTNAMYYRFLDIADIARRGERIRLPLAVTRKMAQRLSGTNDQWASLTVEISEHTIGVRLVAGKPKTPMPTVVNAFVGRDFGYANTVSLSVAVSDKGFDIEAIRTDLERLKSKEAVQSSIKQYALHPNTRIVERVRYSGRNFLKRVHTLCARIDGYQSRIDLNYNALAEAKKTIVSDLGLGPEDRITPEMKPEHPLVREFLLLLGLIHDLKKARRDIYRKIVAIKTAWFGMLSNVEIRLAQQYRAALVREDLTTETIEKNSPVYKGRTFNKMLNNGSKGQYQNRATDKLLWNGVPEIVVPSWYTSRACLTHNLIVDKKHRKGEAIFLPCCDKHDHADEHAADTIASYPALRPRLTQDAGRHPALVTPALLPESLAVGSTGL